MAGFVSEVIDAIKAGDVSDWHFWIGVGIIAFALFAFVICCWSVFAIRRRHRKKKDEAEANQVNLDKFWNNGEQEATTAFAESPVRARGSTRSSLGPKQPSDAASRLPSSHSSHKSRNNGVAVPASSSMPRRDVVKQPSFGKPEIQPASNQPLTPDAVPRASSNRASPTPASKISPQNSVPAAANAKAPSPTPNNMQSPGMYPPGQNPAAYQAQMGMYWPYQMGAYQNPMAANMYQQAQMGAYQAPMMPGVQRQQMAMTYQNPMMAMQQPGMQQPGMQQPGMQQPVMQQPGMQQRGVQPQMGGYQGAMAAGYQAPMMQNAQQLPSASAAYQSPPTNFEQPTVPAVAAAAAPVPSAPPPPPVASSSVSATNESNAPVLTSTTNDIQSPSPPHGVVASEYIEMSEGISDSIAVDDMHVVKLADKRAVNGPATHHVQVLAPAKPPSNAKPGLRPYLAPRKQPDMRSAGFSFAQSHDGESQGYLLADEMGGIMAPTTSLLQSEISSPVHGGTEGAPMGEAVVGQDYSAKLSTEPTLVTKSIVAAMRLSPIRSNVEAYRPGDKPASAISEDQLNQLGVRFWRLETRHRSKDPILVDIRKALDQFSNEVVEMDSEHLDSAAAQSQSRVRIPMYEELLYVDRVVGNGVFLEIMDDMGVWVRVPIREGDMISLPPQLPYRLGIRGCSYSRLIRAHMM